MMRVVNFGEDFPRSLPGFLASKSKSFRAFPRLPWIFSQPLAATPQLPRATGTQSCKILIIP
jgi:hypothetical protein